VRSARRVRILLVVCLTLGTACSGAGATLGPESPTATAVDSSAAPGASPVPGAENALRLPGPDARLPRDPGRLALRLTQTTRALFDAIERWRASGGTRGWPPPREVVLLGLDQQRAIRLLTGDRALREATIAALPPWLRPVVRGAAEAGAAISAGIGRVPNDDALEMRTGPPLPPDVLLRHYRAAERRFGVPWTLLAAVHFMETKFGRVVSPSWAGAQGPMQFLPSTWEAFGLGGDIHDTRDAILGAANYLRATGAPEDMPAALWAYNPVEYYRQAVLRYERLMRRDVRVFYAFYSWQVFVRIRSGAVQLTGPGADVRSST
jgi:transglycosylase-like protein with SLT domain